MKAIIFIALWVSPLLNFAQSALQYAGDEILFDIGTRDEINELKSECIFLSKEDAVRL